MIDDYIPFEGDFKPRVLSEEEAKRHRARLQKALERRNKMANQIRAPHEQDIGG